MSGLINAYRASVSVTFYASPNRCPTARHTGLSSALTIVAALACSATVTDFKFAVTIVPRALDPHAVSSALVLGFLDNVYEGLVRRGKDMAIERSLATSWEPVGTAESWRFTLRQGVTVHDAAAFNTDDVVFSYRRASSKSAEIWGLAKDEQRYIPIHHQVLNWGMTSGVDTIMAPDGTAKLKYFKLKSPKSGARIFFEPRAIPRPQFTYDSV